MKRFLTTAKCACRYDQGKQGRNDMNQILMVLFTLVMLIPIHLSYADNKEGVANQLNVYTLKSGDTLWDIARTRYGNRHYSSIVMTHNNITASHKLNIGMAIKLPGLDTLMEKEGVNRIAKEEMELILSANTLFLSNVHILVNARKGTRRQQPLEIPDATSKDLIVAANKLDQAIEKLSNVKSRGHEVPKSMILQLSKIPDELKKLAAGSNDGYGYDIDMIHQRMIRAINNAIHWSREES